MKSIERGLLIRIMAALLVGSVLVALTTFWVTGQEMHEVFDADLKKVAQGMARYQWTQAGAAQPTPVLVARSDEPDDSEIDTFVWDQSGRLLYASDARVPMPFVREEGLSHPRVLGERWIVYTAIHGGSIAQAAQRRSARRQMAGESAAEILPPLFLQALVVGGLLVYGLRRGLRPLDVAARDVASRSARSLEPIESAAVPREMLPMVRAINGLMARLDQSLEGQRRFVADAAHELRTPITALRLQLSVLERSTEPEERRAASAALRQGMERAQRLIEQLLAVARAEPEACMTPMQALDLCDVVREVVQQMSVKAAAWGLDLGVQLAGPVVVVGDAEQLTVLLNNLVENALSYTPAGGVVDVGAELRNGEPVIYVRDTGPGIAPEVRARVFDRFVRGGAPKLPDRPVVGSGLGLSIVKMIAERHGATVRLASGPEGREGLLVTVVFPRLPTGGGEQT